MANWIQRAAIALAVVVLASPAGAQDYRARVQGTIMDASQGALPGATVTLVNPATGVEATRVSDANGRYVFDFVDPGTYKMRAELDGFRAAQHENVRVMQRGNVEVSMVLELGTIAEMITVTAPPVAVQFHNSSTLLTVESQIIDQAPIAGRNPYNLSTLDPSVLVSATTNENRPYHHAFANDYDAGGGTRRANDVLLDGVPLGASYKTSYTPAMDAVEEVTVSKNSVDAENGNSLGGIISLNMKAGTNQLRGSAYSYFRDPSMNAVTDPTLIVPAGTEPIRGSELQMFGGTVGAPLIKNRVFSFTSYENWNDSRPLSIVRTVPTELERQGNFSQSALNGAVRTIYNPFASTLDASGRVVRTPFAGNQIPTAMLDPVALKMLQQMPMPNLGGNVDNLQYTVAEIVNYWNFSQRVDVNFNDNFKIFGRIGVFKADLYQDNPIGSNAGFFPLSGSNRDGMSTAGDAVWIMSNKTTLNVRGSYYNMVDEFYNPSLLLGADGLANYWPSQWYEPLYNSGYAYYPALDVTSGTGTGTTNRLGRQGREWYQHPDAWTMSARMNRYQGEHNLKWGGEVRSYFGSGARFEPINLVFNSALTANSSDAPQVATTGNQWASFMLGGLDNQTSARLVPLQTVNIVTFSSYVQDDWDVNDRLTLNMGLRWEFEPGAYDPENRMSQQLDLTQPIPEMQATPPSMPASAAQLMASKGYSWTYNGAWQFTTAENRSVWSTTWKNFLPRFGVNYRIEDKSVLRFAYARFRMPLSNLRDTLGDFVNQYTGFAQTTNTLGLFDGRPQQVLNNPFPDATNPVQEEVGQTLGRYTGLGNAVSFDQYGIRPQVNDRLNLSYQRQLPWGMVIDAAYFFNHGTRVPYNVNLNMRDPAFTYEQGAALNAQVPNPFRNYLTPDVFPGSLRNQTTVALGSLLVPYPQYGTITRTNTSAGRTMWTQSLDFRLQRPFRRGISFLSAYTFQRDRIQNFLSDIDEYEVLTSGGKSGWEWQPVNPALPEHRFTSALTVQIPIGRDQPYMNDMPAALDAILGGWQYTTTVRLYSGRPVFFNTNQVTGDPTLENPTRDLWFDVTKFAAQPAFTPRTNPVSYSGLNGPGATFVDMTLTKAFHLGPRYRMEARFEAYNALNHIIWDQPETTFGNPNFGKVTRKRTDSLGREIQVGVRFVF